MFVSRLFPNTHYPPTLRSSGGRAALPLDSSDSLGAPTKASEQLYTSIPSSFDTLPYLCYFFSTAIPVLKSRRIHGSWQSFPQFNQRRYGRRAV